MSAPEPGSDRPLPFTVSGTPEPGDWMRRQLFERRIVTVSGPLDDAAVTEVGAALMTLDAMGDDPVHLQFDCDDGTVGAALALMDIIDLSGVPVRGMGLGQVAGPAVGAFAVCSRRTLSPHARIRLFEPRVQAEGDARQLQQLATAHLDQWSAFCSRVAATCAQPEDRVRHDAAVGRFLSAREAVDYGLADEVAAPDAPMVRLPGRPLGFGRG